MSCAAHDSARRGTWIGRCQRAAAVGLAGATAATAMLLVPQQWRLGLALFTGVRAADLLLRRAARVGVVPALPHPYLWLMAASSAELVYGGVFAPGAMDASALQCCRGFFHALRTRHATRTRHALTAAVAQVLWCVAAYRKWLRPYIGVPVPVTSLLARTYDPACTWHELGSAACMRGAPLPPAPLRTRNRMACHVIHPGRGCTHWLGAQCASAYRAALGVYVPFVAMQTVVFRRRKLASMPLGTLASGAATILRSSLFLSAFTGGVWAVQCGAHSLLGVHKAWVVALCGAVGGSSLVIEPASRRPELALYGTAAG